MYSVGVKVGLEEWMRPQKKMFKCVIDKDCLLPVHNLNYSVKN